MKYDALCLRDVFVSCVKRRANYLRKKKHKTVWKGLNMENLREKFERDTTQTLRGRDAFDLQDGMDIV